MKKEERKKKKEELLLGSEMLFIVGGVRLASNVELFANDELPFIHLQWFADDDEDAPGRTEEPTEYKLRRLREEGQVNKSQDLISALSLLLPALLILFLAPYMLRNFVELIVFFFSRINELDPINDKIVAGIFFRYFIKLVWPILAIAFVSAIFSNVAQIGFLFTVKPITPDLSRVLPRVGQYFRRITSIDGLYKLGTSVAKMLIIGLTAYFLIRADLGKLTNLQKADLWQGFTTVAMLAIKMLIISAILMLILAVPDIIFQRIRFYERNKMSRQEIKEELKQTEPDPRIQNRIRARFSDLLKQNIAETVPKADVVITNPTHLAIALEYNPRYLGPMVTAIGADETAARIREIAMENDVPLVENKPLAWALFRDTKVGEVIPEAYYKTVAAILSKVWYINEQRRRKESA